MPTNWNKIKAEYIAGGTSYRKLAEKYGVSFSSVRRRSEKDKWTDLRTQAEQKTSAKIVEKAASQKAKEADRISSVADKLLALIESRVESGAIDLTARGYRDITGALKDLREIKGIKSETDLAEQMARIEKLRRDAEPEEKKDNEVHIVIEGDLGDFAK